MSPQHRLINKFEVLGPPPEYRLIGKFANLDSADLEARKHEGATVHQRDLKGNLTAPRRPKRIEP